MKLKASGRKTAEAIAERKDFTTSGALSAHKVEKNDYVKPGTLREWRNPTHHASVRL